MEIKETTQSAMLIIALIIALCGIACLAGATSDYVSTRHFAGWRAYSFDEGPIFADHLPTMPEQYGAKGDGVHRRYGGNSAGVEQHAFWRHDLFFRENLSEYFPDGSTWPFYSWGNPFLR